MNRLLCVIRLSLKIKFEDISGAVMKQNSFTHSLYIYINYLFILLFVLLLQIENFL
jgi:hypothetical protein